MHERAVLSSVALLLVFGLSAQAAEYSGYAVLTSDYVKRGVTQSDGDPAVQLGGDVAFKNGLYAGIWGSSVDIKNGATRQRDIEVNYYLGYIWDVTARWQINTNVVVYRYPGASGDINYEYVEYTLAGNFDDQIWLAYSYSPDLFQTGQSTQNFDAYAEWPIGENWALGGGGGYYDVSNLSNRGYGYWQLGLTRYFVKADVDLRYHDANRWVSFVSSPNRVDGRVSLTLRFPF